MATQRLFLGVAMASWIGQNLIALHWLQPGLLRHRLKF
tara:strand:+ start:359 stop:472 length:114 start_codon:yes stop_codon:yes gene_type:complete